MELQLKNIGMIKEANVSIDGLTVIAGENDTGKSTLGKSLFLILNVLHDRYTNPKKFLNDNGRFWNYESIKDKIFPNLKIDTLKLMIDNRVMEYKDIYFESDTVDKVDFKSSLFIETPLIWNFTDFFRDIAQVESQMRIELDYPYLMKDLNFKLHIKNAFNGFDIKKQMIDLMGGEFKKDEMGRYYFDKQGQKIELINTATGIKYFGIFQVLSENNYLNKDTVLVLDEPEVHLHPKWQLEMAKIIVELVQNGVKIVVNSHSPYMIEALQRYAELEKVNSNFYLAEDGYIKKENDSNSQTLVAIYEKLSEPYDVFEQMESDRFQNG